MKFLALLILVFGSSALACETCSDSKRKAPAVFSSVQLPAHVKVFTDFTCRYCKIGSNTMDNLSMKYGNKIDIEPVAFPLTKKGPGFEAAKYFEAFKSIAPEKALDYARSLHSSKKKTKKTFIKLAKNLGVDTRALKRKANSREILSTLEENREEAKKHNINGTPGYLFNGSKAVTGARPASFFDDLFGNILIEDYNC